MNSIDLMVDEHKFIKRMLVVVRKACLNIFNGAEIDYNDFEEIIDFIRNYADKHHHGKEEKFLFKEMQTYLGSIGNNLITHGMLVEHDLGRLYISELVDALNRVREGEEESKLDVISNAISYTHLLTRHIAKEDELVYSYGGKNLSESVIEDINKRTDEYESNAQKEGIQDKYIGILDKLEEKYNIK